jgi:hypothetical protein
MMVQVLDIDDPFLNAALSLDVYRHPDRPPLPAGWKVYKDCPSELQIDGIRRDYNARYFDVSISLFNSIIFLS